MRILRRIFSIITRRMRERESVETGYTLAEMAVVLAIMGTMAGGILSLGSVKHEASKLELTQERLDTLEEALRRFSYAAGYLPCPADPTALPGDADYGVSADCTAAAPAGISATGAGSSEVWIGTIPTRTLNLPDATMYDAWLDRFTYAVVNDLATTAANFTNYSAGTATGVIQILDEDGTQITDVLAETVVAYALVSHGKDKKGGYTRSGTIPIVCGAATKDDENCDGDAVFRDSRITDSTASAGYFDDMLRWKTQHFMQPADSDTGLGATKYIYVADYSNHRVQKFDSSGNYVSQFGSNGVGDGLFRNPAGIAVDGNGYVWVADMNNHRVQKFDSSGNYVSQIGSSTPISGNLNGQFNAPRSLAFDSGGNVYVTDYSNHRVQKFTGAGVYVSQFGKAPPGTSGSGNGEFINPNGIAIDGSGNIWVVDMGNNRVQKFNSAGVYQNQIGSSAPASGVGNGEFSQPIDIAIDSSGNLLVTDGINNRVQKFDSNGVYQSQFGNGLFVSGPRDLAIDSGGNVWVVDWAGHRVQKFDGNGVYQSRFGSGPASGNGQFNTPMGIAVGTR